MIRGLGADFWVCLCWVGVLFLSFCFRSGFSECVVCVLPLLLACLVGVLKGECFLVLEAGRRGDHGDTDLTTHPWLPWNLLCRPCWPQTHRDLPASNSQVLEQKASATMPCLRTLFKFGLYTNSARYFLYPNSRMREKSSANLSFTQNSDQYFLFILTCKSSLDGTFGDQGCNSKIELLASICKSPTQLSLTKRKEKRGE